jgi:hypothetical protein
LSSTLPISDKNTKQIPSNHAVAPCPNFLVETKRQQISFSKVNNTPMEQQKNKHLTDLVPPATKWNILNLGAGVQSSTLALMAATGELGPALDAAVFADTQAEPDSVYRWLDWLEGEINRSKHPFPVYRVTKGSLTEDSLSVRLSKAGNERMPRIIPMFGITPEGKKTAALGRSCTRDYKIRMILKKIKKLCSKKYGQKETTITQWIGISYDEMQRMKGSAFPWTQHRWPLIELRMRRADCIRWMLDHGYPEPPRSACVYCPFHGDSEWRRLRDDEPHEFEKAVLFDKTLRKAHAVHNKNFRMKVYLHRSCKPLSEIDFNSDEQDPQQVWDFQSECEGMCGV